LERYNNGEMLHADSFHANTKQSYKTNGGRKVFGGGGIMPDIFVAVDSGLYTRSITELYLDGRFNNFVYTYYINHLSEFQNYKTPSDFANTYQNTGDAWKQLVRYAMKDSINLSKIPVAERQEVEDRMKAYLARFRWRTQGFYEVSNSKDKVIQKAKEVLK